MSASLPNIEDVAEWLDAKIIRNDKRQIPLEMVAYFHHSFDNIQ
jgi:replicative superfamily II helicase